MNEAGSTVTSLRSKIVELCSLLARKLYEKQLSTTDEVKLRTDFLVHVDRDDIDIPIDIKVVLCARDLVGKYPLLRSLDSVQLATASVSAAAVEESLIKFCQVG